MSDDQPIVYRKIRTLNEEEREIIEVIRLTKNSNILNYEVCLRKREFSGSNSIKAEWFVWVKLGPYYEDAYTVEDQHYQYSVHDSNTRSRWARIKKNKLPKKTK